MLVDSINDRLFVADVLIQPSILIFEHASSRTGDIPPDRVISGGATTITSPTTLALDGANNLLYVDNGFSGNILVFGSASTINGNVAPVRTITLGFQTPSLVLDTSGNRLFVENGNSIAVYDGASSLNGAVTASRMISGASTQLEFPGAMQLDSAGRLFVANGTSAHGTQSILVFANAGTANGNVVPTAIIAGPNTMLHEPVSLALSPAGELFVGEAVHGVLVFAPAATANGNVSPVRVLDGDKTGLFTTPGIGNLTSITVDPNH